MITQFITGVFELYITVIVGGRFKTCVYHLILILWKCNIRKMQAMQKIVNYDTH